MAAASRRRPNYHDLTDRQRRIYDFIKDANDLRGYPCLLYTSDAADE